ncbi:MAG TPA: choice-of-anchor tandem repeat GloVer-containing protein, partial [Blastocatellia bacterium]
MKTNTPLLPRSHSSRAYKFAVCLIVLGANIVFGILTSANTTRPANYLQNVAMPPARDTSGISSNGLIQTPDGSLYWTVAAPDGGSTSAGQGQLIRFTPDGQAQSLHVFDGEDGAQPTGRLLYAADGNIYGVTAEGGEHGAGTIYRINPSGANFEVVHSFSPQEGRSPSGGLVADADGNLYGTADLGGSGYGTAFAISVDGRLTVLHDFSGTDGSDPSSGLIFGQDGFLYGTAEEGGTASKGTVFSMSVTGSSFQILHNFDGPDGASPECGLVQTVDGSFFGAARKGGASSDGVLFKILPDGNGFALVHSFTGYNFVDPTDSDGANPISIITGGDGYLYGATARGGRRDDGVIYRLNPQTGQTDILFSYRKSEGNPAAGLLAISGTVYMPVVSGKRV